MIHRSIAIAALALGAVASRADTVASVPLPPDLARVLADYEAAWQAKDARALAALFAEDGFVLTGGHAPVRGRADIERHYQGKGGPLALRALAYAAEGPTGYIIGAYGPARGAEDAGKFTLTLRRGDRGRWLIMSDMDNGNGPRPPVGASGAAAPAVAFVCEHGTVKSVMAMEMFNRRAAERGLPFRAVARGISPDAAVPPMIREKLRAEGFDVGGFHPAPIREADVSAAQRVVAIGAQSPLLAGSNVVRWDDVPPATTDYAASRDAMRARMDALLDELVKESAGR